MINIVKFIVIDEKGRQQLMQYNIFTGGFAVVKNVNAKGDIENLEEIIEKCSPCLENSLRAWGARTVRNQIPFQCNDIRFIILPNYNPNKFWQR